MPSNKLRKRAKIRSRYNQAPHLTQDTNGIVTTYLDTMDLFAIPGIIKQLPWQLDFPYLHIVMALPERHTDVSIHELIEISSNTKMN